MITSIECSVPKETSKTFSEFSVFNSLSYLTSSCSDRSQMCNDSIDEMTFLPVCDCEIVFTLMDCHDKTFHE